MFRICARITVYDESYNKVIEREATIYVESKSKAIVIGTDAFVEAADVMVGAVDSGIAASTTLDPDPPQKM